MWEVRERDRVVEDGSFQMELLKIASGNQIRSIKILSIAVAEKSKTENSNTKTLREQINKHKLVGCEVLLLKLRCQCQGWSISQYVYMLFV